jgi:hypothetical protein
MANYNESRIYKIYCTLSTINEFYIGSSARYEERCILHKSDCNNINSIRYSLKLYQYIRNNGGWNNFTVEVLEKYPCKNRTELNIREEWWKKQEQPTLNERKAHRTINDKKEYNNEKTSEYYHNNSTNIKLKANEVIKCSICNKTFTRANRSTHQKSKYCQNYKSTSSESSTESIIHSDSESD